jgi:hypothetical protein
VCSWSGRPPRPRTQHDYHHDTKVKPEAATAVIKLLMMGGKTPETCWAVNKLQDNKLKNYCISLVIYMNYSTVSDKYVHCRCRGSADGPRNAQEQTRIVSDVSVNCVWRFVYVFLKFRYASSGKVKRSQQQDEALLITCQGRQRGV